MKKEYDLNKLKKRTTKVAAEKSAAKVPLSIRLDGSVLAGLKTEALRLGIPYQTFIGSILHRYAEGELIDRKSAELVKLLRGIS